MNKYKTYTYSMGPFLSEEEATTKLNEELFFISDIVHTEVYRTVFKQSNGWRCEFKYNILEID